MSKQFNTRSLANAVEVNIQANLHSQSIRVIEQIRQELWLGLTSGAYNQAQYDQAKRARYARLAVMYGEVWQGVWLDFAYRSLNKPIMKSL